MGIKSFCTEINPSFNYIFPWTFWSCLVWWSAYEKNTHGAHNYRELPSCLQRALWFGVYSEAWKWFYFLGICVLYYCRLIESLRNSWELHALQQKESVHMHPIWENREATRSQISLFYFLFLIFFIPSKDMECLGGLNRCIYWLRTERHNVSLSVVSKNVLWYYSNHVVNMRNEKFQHKSRRKG